jgi:hypothetical protein
MIRSVWPLLLAAVLSVAAVAEERQLLASRVTTLTRTSVWTPVATIPIRFSTFHPQGLVKIGDTFILSSVEVRTPTRRYPSPVDGYDRDAGEGVGHLFKFDLQGNVLAEQTLADGTVYHPGGLDYDGEYVWVPLAEYRPDSRSIVYKVDPRTLAATRVLDVRDHIGGVVHNTDDRTLHGVSWGSRRFYRWTMDRQGRVTNAAQALERLRTVNPAHYVDYQDCKYASERRMLCTGLAEYRQTPSSPAFRLGGLELISLIDGRPLHQVPVPLWTASGTDMTHNPVWIEPSGTGLRAYFMPEDDRSTLYIYDVGQTSPIDARSRTIKHHGQKSTIR